MKIEKWIIPIVEIYLCLFQVVVLIHKNTGHKHIIYPEVGKLWKQTILETNNNVF